MRVDLLCDLLLSCSILVCCLCKAGSCRRAAGVGRWAWRPGPLENVVMGCPGLLVGGPDCSITSLYTSVTHLPPGHSARVFLAQVLRQVPRVPGEAQHAAPVGGARSHLALFPAGIISHMFCFATTVPLHCFFLTTSF